MLSPDVVDLSRLQFAVTALYHFLFVPLTLGLSWILVIMESVYVLTGREVYRDMSRYKSPPCRLGQRIAVGTTPGKCESASNRDPTRLECKGKISRSMGSGFAR